MSGAKSKKVNKNKNRSVNNKGSKSKGKTVLQYVQGVTERVARVLKSHNIDAAIKPHNTLRRELVHPKDKRDPLTITHAIYETPCKNCNLVYVGETGRKFGTRIEEHKRKSAKRSRLEPGERTA